MKFRPLRLQLKPSVFSLGIFVFFDEVEFRALLGFSNDTDFTIFSILFFKFVKTKDE